MEIHVREQVFSLATSLNASTFNLKEKIFSILMLLNTHVLKEILYNLLGIGSLFHNVFTSHFFFSKTIITNVILVKWSLLLPGLGGGAREVNERSGDFISTRCCQDSQPLLPIS